MEISLLNDVSRMSGELLQEHAGAGARQGACDRLVIRRAGRSDEDAMRGLFAVRRHSEESAPGDARGPDLDNPSRNLWLALNGDRAVGMTSVQERSIRIGNGMCRIAYWTGLFIDPAYRSHFVYPRLMSAMFAGLRERGIHHLYAAVRRQQIAEAHQKIGFKKIGDMAVLAKPLKPALLFAKYRRLVAAGQGQRFLRLLCSVPDAMAGMGIRLQGPRASEEWKVAQIQWTSSEVSDLAQLYTHGCAGATAQTWSAESLRTRYAPREFGYQLLGVQRQGRLCAAVIVRMVDRSDGIRAAVIMDLIHEPGAMDAAKLALVAVEQLALASGCDVIIFLDGLPSCDNEIVRKRAYLKSSEKYSLLLWKDRRTDTACFPEDLRSWRFSFGDHDTF